MSVLIPYGARRQIAHGGSLTEILDIINPVGEERGGAGKYISGPVAAPEPTAEPSLPFLSTIRRRITCSGCGIQDHNISRCPQRV